jgi:DNA ligase 1
MSLFAPFTELCDALAGTTARLEKRALIADYLHSLPVDDAGRAALWLSGAPFAETDNRVLNVGGSLLQKAVAEISGASSEAMSAAYRRHGDFGAAAADLLWSAKPDHAPLAPTLTLAEVESAFAALAEARGPAPKLRQLLELFLRATPDETKYLIKLATGDMRTGVKQSLVEEAIAEAWPAAPASVRRASMLVGSLPEVVRLAAAGQLDQARMQLFHPLGFMLASPVASSDEAIARCSEEIAEEHGETPPQPRESALREAQLEDKYDGIRAQLHCDGSRVALYSRNRDDLTASFPELAEAFGNIGEQAILDGEILAWNPANQRALPFSALQQRLGRKRVTAEMRREIPVVLVVFDILYRGNRLLLDEHLVQRRAALEDFCARWAPATAAIEPGGQSHLFAVPYEQTFPRLILAAATRLTSGEDLDRAYLDARGRGNEGVMIKSLASRYQPGRRGLAWLKLKRELATLDVVVTGVEFGNGRRAAVLSDYTFAIRDTDDQEAPLKNVGKAYSGLTDQEIAEMTAWFKAHTLEDFGHHRTVEPTVVLEVAFNNVMRSTRHASGFALRFPRILRIRTDKPVAEIDTLRRVAEIYNSQPDRPSDPENESPAQGPPGTKQQNLV